MPSVHQVNHESPRASSAIELIVWREPGDREWHARVIDGVSRGGIAMAPGADPWAAVAAALAGYARLTGQVAAAPPVGRLHPAPSGGRKGRESHRERALVAGGSSHSPGSVQSLVTSANGRPMLGNPEARIRIVEFLDYECPFCKRAAPEVRAFMTRHPDDVLLIVRDFPLESIHEHAFDAAIDLLTRAVPA